MATSLFKGSFNFLLALVPVLLINYLIQQRLHHLGCCVASSLLNFCFTLNYVVEDHTFKFSS